MPPARTVELRNDRWTDAEGGSMKRNKKYVGLAVPHPEVLPPSLGLDSHNPCTDSGDRSRGGAAEVDRSRL